MIRSPLPTAAELSGEFDQLERYPAGCICLLIEWDMETKNYTTTRVAVLNAVERRAVRLAIVRERKKRREAE